MYFFQNSKIIVKLFFIKVIQLNEGDSNEGEFEFYNSILPFMNFTILPFMNTVFYI